jgi:hypothetical protein
MRQVVIHLHAQPRVGCAADGLFEADGHFRRNAAAPGNHLVELLARDANRLGCILDGDAKLFTRIVPTRRRRAANRRETPARR